MHVEADTTAFTEAVKNELVQMHKLKGVKVFHICCVQAVMKIIHNFSSVH